MEQMILFVIVLGFYLLGFYHGVTSKYEKIEYVDRYILPENIMCRTCGTCGGFLQEEKENDTSGLQD